MSVSDDLRWYFQHADHQCEIEMAMVLLPSYALSRDMPIAPRAIAKARAIRNTLREIGPHADVLAAAFEQKAYPFALTSKVGDYAGAAMRTSAANSALRVVETEERTHTRQVPPSSLGSPWSDLVLGTTVGAWSDWQRRTDAAASALPTEVAESIIGLDEKVSLGRPSHTAFEAVSGNHGSRRGMLGFLAELPADSTTLRAVKSESRQAVANALAAFIAARTAPAKEAA